MAKNDENLKDPVMVQLEGTIDYLIDRVNHRVRVTDLSLAAVEAEILQSLTAARLNLIKAG